MMSFLFEIDERSEKVARFIGRVRKELVRALVDAKRHYRVSQNDIAAKLDVNASVLSRQLSGEGNLTLKTVADLAWALDKEPFFELREPERNREINYFIETTTKPIIAPSAAKVTAACPMKRLPASGSVRAHVFENVM